MGQQFKCNERVVYKPTGWVGVVKEVYKARWFGMWRNIYTLDMEDGDFVGTPFNASENNLEREHAARN